MGLTSLHDYYGSWHFYTCCALLGYSTFLLLQSCLWRTFHVELLAEILSWVLPRDRSMGHPFVNDLVQIYVISFICRPLLSSKESWSKYQLFSESALHAPSTFKIGAIACKENVGVGERHVIFLLTSVWALSVEKNLKNVLTERVDD